jgi:purine-binding chemotaxis protein CheW
MNLPMNEPVRVPAGAQPPQAAPDAAEYLTFRLLEETYGIPILKVQEIRGYEQPTAIANAPRFIRGVINLRGLIVPILDLRIKFGQHDVAYDQFTVVIILNVANRVVGIVVDAVSDVVAFAPDDIKPAPEFASRVLDTRAITGLANREDRLVILLDIESLMAGADMALVN